MNEADYKKPDYTTSHVSSWLETLGHLAGKKAYGIEIGCLEGRSSVWFLENILTHDNSGLVCIDPWSIPGTEETFDEVTRKWQSDFPAPSKLSKRKGLSYQCLREMPLNSFDFVYIDGCHQAANVIEDAVLSFRLLKKFGVMIFDDYPWDNGVVYQPPAKAIDAFLFLYADRIELLHKDWQVAVVKMGDWADATQDDRNLSSR